MIAQALRERVEQQSFRATFDQTRAELAQDRVVEAGVDQRQTECVFPVDPSAYGIRGLTVGQALDELQHRRESEPSRCFGGLATAGEQGRELTVGVDRTQFAGDVQTERAFRERRPSYSIGLFRYGRRLLRMQRHAGSSEENPTGCSFAERFGYAYRVQKKERSKRLVTDSGANHYCK